MKEHFLLVLENGTVQVQGSILLRGVILLFSKIVQ